MQIESSDLYTYCQTPIQGDGEYWEDAMGDQSASDFYDLCQQRSAHGAIVSLESYIKSPPFDDPISDVHGDAMRRVMGSYLLEIGLL